MTKKKSTSPQTPRRKKRDAPDPEWTYSPPTLSAKGEAFLSFWLTKHPPTLEEGLTVFVHEPIIRHILHVLESSPGVPTSEERARVTGYTSHIGGYADRLLFHAGTRAERERVFIELVEALAVLAFAPGGLPRLPQICDAFRADVLSQALASFQEDQVWSAETGEHEPGASAIGDLLL